MGRPNKSGITKPSTAKYQADWIAKLTKEQRVERTAKNTEAKRKSRKILQERIEAQKAYRMQQENIRIQQEVQRRQVAGQQQYHFQQQQIQVRQPVNSVQPPQQATAGRLQYHHNAAPAFAALPAMPTGNRFGQQQLPIAIQQYNHNAAPALAASPAVPVGNRMNQQVVLDPMDVQDLNDMAFDPLAMTQCHQVQQAVGTHSLAGPVNNGTMDPTVIETAGVSASNAKPASIEDDNLDAAYTLADSTASSMMEVDDLFDFTSYDNLDAGHTPADSTGSPVMEVDDLFNFTSYL